MIRPRLAPVVTIPDLVDDVLRCGLRAMQQGRKPPTVYYVSAAERRGFLKLMAKADMELAWRVSNPADYPERFTIMGVLIKAYDDVGSD